MNARNVVCLFLLMAATAQARLGETRQMVIKRYGRPVRTEKNERGESLWFNTPEFAVFVSIPRAGGEVAREVVYTKNGKVSIEQAMHLLNANSQGHRWRKVDPDEGRFAQWARSDGAKADVLMGSPEAGMVTIRFFNHTPETTPPEAADDGTDQAQDPLDAGESRLTGVGVTLSKQGDRFTVDKVLPGSAAEAAGLPAGAHVLAIGGQELKGKTLQDADDMLRGPEGTTVEISVAQDFGLWKTYTIERRRPQPDGFLRLAGTYTATDRTDEEYIIEKTGARTIKISCPANYWSGSGIVTDTYVKGVFLMEDRPDVREDYRGAVGYFRLDFQRDRGAHLVFSSRFTFQPGGEDVITRRLVRK